MTAIIEDTDAIRADMANIVPLRCNRRDGMSWGSCQTCGMRPCLMQEKPEASAEPTALSELTITPWFREMRL